MASAGPVKGILQILRRDAALAGDADALAVLGLLVFLKAIDEHETELEILDERYASPIPLALRWRRWATAPREAGPDALLHFVRELLLPGLRAIPVGRHGDVATVLRQVAEVARFPMRSGAALAGAVDALGAVDLGTLSARRAFREEFLFVGSGVRPASPGWWAPPSLARALVDAVDPELGESILDLSAGAGAFLVAAAERLRERWVRAPDHEAALARSLAGFEPSPLGWLLATTNLLLHGVLAPVGVRLGDPRERWVQARKAAERAEIVVGAAPFGQTVSSEIALGLPPAFRTRDPAALHLLLAMDTLREGGRAAIVVPDGVLSGDGVMARVREKLLEECDVHTIVRLPGGLLAPATTVKLSALFFTRGRPTQRTWHFELPPPSGLKGFGRRRPVRAEDFEPLRRWWDARVESEAAYEVGIDEIRAADFNLDRVRGVAREAVPDDVESVPDSEPRVPASLAEGFRLGSLRLRQFRGFDKLDLDLPPEGPAVLIGLNGAGKSSVLDAVGALLSALAAAISGGQTRHAEISLGAGDVRAGQDLGSVGAAFTVAGEAQYWTAKITRARGSAALASEIAAFGQRLLEGVRGREAVNLPVLCHYPASRTMGDEGGKRSGATLYPQLQIYERAFRRGVGPFQDFLRWFRLEEGLENQIRLREDPAHRNPRLTLVRSALQKFLGELGGATFSDLRIERSADDREGALVIEKDRVPLRIEQLSEGERNTLLIVSDLARRLAVANPAREEPLRGEGIVLIDEIDLHLHPGWQRGILPALCATFAGIQFLVSTHSPQVLTRIKREHVFIFEGFQLVKGTPYTYGRDPNSILSEVFGLPERPADIAGKLRRLSVLLDEEKVPESRAALAELEEILGHHDVELVRLRTVLSFVETPVEDEG